MLFIFKQFIKNTYLAIRRTTLNLLSFIFTNKTNFSPKTLNSLLIIAPPRIGDAALISSTFHSIKLDYPNIKIYVLANNYTSELFALIEEIDQIIVIEDSFLSRFKYLFPKTRFKFDLAIDLNFDYHLWTALLAASAGSYSIGYNIDGRGFLFKKKLPKPAEGQHARDIFSEPIRQLLPYDETTAYHLNVPDGIKTEVNSSLVDIHISNADKLILIHPGAHHPTQRWLPKYFAEVANYLIETENTKLIFIGGPAEKVIIKQITSLMQNEPDGVFTNLGVKNLAGLTQRADLLICNNSGPLHIAVATNTPTISTMGPTVKDRWMPQGGIHKVLRKDDLPCIGCNLGYCKIKTHDCMRLIKPKMLLESVNENLFK